MKNIKMLIISLSILLIMPLIVRADCESDFKTVEDQFKFSYKYNEDTDDFTITLVNPNYELYSFRRETLEEIDNAKNSIDGKKITSVTEHYKSTTYKYGIVMRTDACRDIVIRQYTIELKKYNPYADSPLCVGNEDFVLCQKDYDKQITEAEFESRLETYVKSKENSEFNGGGSNSENNGGSNSNSSNNGGTKTSIFSEVLNYLRSHVIETIIITVFIIVVVISVILMIRKNAKSRRLE